MNLPKLRIPICSLAMLISVTIGGAALAQSQRAVVEAVHRTVMSSELTGRVTALPKRPGEAFAKGDVLARVDCSLYEAKKDTVLTQLRQARHKLENKQRLAELDSVGDLAVELARLDVSEARGDLEVARIKVDRCRVTAPFDGRVVKVYASEYQSVRAQDKLLEIVGQRLEVRAIVPATWLDWIETGAPMALAVEETGATVAGKVVRVGAAVDPVSHTIPVWAQLDGAHDGLRPGMSGAVRFPDRPQEIPE
mgnify:FL=1